MSVLTLTLNPCVDHILQIDVIQIHQKNFVSERKTYLGGKGINAAFALGKLGVPTTALGLIGKNTFAEYNRKMQNVGVTPAFTPVEGNTRQAYKIMESSTDADTEFNESGGRVLPDEVKNLRNTVRKYIGQGSWLMLCGSLPAGIAEDIYADLIRESRSAGGKTLLDTSGEALLEGIKAVPTILRINKSELVEVFPELEAKKEGMKQAIQSLFESGIENVIVSMGKDGTIGFDGEILWKVSIPAMEIISLTGAGDAMSAGVIASFIEGKSFPDCLRFSSALASASTLKQEPGDFEPAALSDLLSRVKVENIAAF